MNPAALALSLDNLLVLLALVLLSAGSSWLTKKRSRKEAGHGPDEAELPPSPGTQARSTRQLALEEALRQLLAGVPSPQAPPPPPIPSAWRDEPPRRLGLMKNHSRRSGPVPVRRARRRAGGVT